MSDSHVGNSQWGDSKRTSDLPVDKYLPDLLHFGMKKFLVIVNSHCLDGSNTY
uniref:Uncharacterized protein n=1 Tax=Romanomermis culicivorax TaxID=13658 RepID=A0A915HLJ1_ROMCU